MFVACVEYLRWVLMIVILLNYKSREFTIVVFNKHVNHFDWKLPAWKSSTNSIGD